MIELKLTSHEASVVWAALLVAEDTALNNAASGYQRQKALDMANELRALRNEISLRQEALREQA